MHNLRFRQIHLDFHTSPKISGIGARFQKKEWQETLKRGHVDSITLFSKCHHGWSYHPTKVGKQHPHLNVDLLKAQYDATKEIGVNAPIYLSAGVDNLASYEHPEWREINNEGQYTGWARGALDAGFHMMDFHSPYLAYLCAQIEEAVRLFPDCDGIFLDIISQNQSCTRWSLDFMLEQGLDPEQEEDRKKSSALALEKYYQQTTAAARILNPDMPIFHNSGHVDVGNTTLLDRYFSHLELESLPTGGWGYDHFPASAKYAQNLPHDFLGMTGKFHTTWGEFGGAKHPNALRYECAAMLAFGAKCSVGDQLHPDGKLDASTYELVGAAYQEVEAKEAWCRRVKPVADIALVSSNSVNPGHRREMASDVGASRILLEGHFLYTILDTKMDFRPYKLLILPDDVVIGTDLEEKLKEYLAGGGKLFLSGTSGLDSTGTRFLFDVGANYEGESPFRPDYILPVPDLRPEFQQSPQVMYLKSQRIRATTGRSLGQIFDPYFNRTFEHFCSHQHAPNQPEPSGFDSGVLHGQILYLAHPVFSLYRGYGTVAYRHYITNAIKLLLGEDLSLWTNLPSTARVSVMHQPEESRTIVHLLYANTVTRGGVLTLSGGTTANTQPIAVIEELNPLTEVNFAFKSPHPVKRVTLEPQGTPLAVKQKDNIIEVTLDRLVCHQMVVLHHE
ncbi:MAG: alpha-amylase family protein [Candidatus Methylacidiphilales bacterium]